MRRSCGASKDKSQALPCSGAGAPENRLADRLCEAAQGGIGAINPAFSQAQDICTRRIAVREAPHYGRAASWAGNGLQRFWGVAKR